MNQMDIWINITKFNKIVCPKSKLKHNVLSDDIVGKTIKNIVRRYHLG